MNRVTRTAPERVLERLEWKVLRRLDGLFQGDYRTVFHGSGVDVTDLREYQSGDDVRHMDWNVTARTNTAHVRQFAEDRELTAWFVCDQSASMGFGSGERSKEIVLVDVVAALARLLTRGGSRVAALAWNDTTDRVITPRTGRNQVLRIVRDLQRRASSSSAGVTRLGDLLTDAHRQAGRRSLIFVLSDFITEPGWERPLQVLARKHDVVAIRIVDPSESELPDTGTVVLQDAETGEQLVVDTSDPVFRSRLAEVAAEREQALSDAVRRIGVTMHTVATDEDLVAALVRLVEHRRRMTVPRAVTR